MNPGNYREALIETSADESEGADILMVRQASHVRALHSKAPRNCSH